MGDDGTFFLSLLGHIQMEDGMEDDMEDAMGVDNAIVISLIHRLQVEDGMAGFQAENGMARSHNDQRCLI